MSEGPVKPPQSLRGKLRALYTIFGWKMPAVATIGLLFSVAAATIPFLGRRPIGWLEETTFATLAGFLTIMGVTSLRERWLSLGPLEGFHVRRSRPRPILRWMACGALMVLGSVLVIGWFVDPPADERMRWIAPLMGGCCLIGALAIARLTLMHPRHVLVREGLLLRHRDGCTLIPWERVAHIAIGTFTENIVATVLLSDLLTPLPTVWRTAMSQEQQQCCAERQLKAFQQTRSWQGADLLIWGWSCKVPPGLFALQARQALADPAAREQLPPFEHVAGTAPPSQK